MSFSSEFKHILTGFIQHKVVTLPRASQQITLSRFNFDIFPTVVHGFTLKENEKFLFGPTGEVKAKKLQDTKI